jgi:hypothetical protein
VVGAVVASSIARSREAGLPPASHPAWWILTGLGALVLVLGLIATTARARASARRTAEQLNPEALIA